MATFEMKYFCGGCREWQDGSDYRMKTQMAGAVTKERQSEQERSDGHEIYFADVGHEGRR
jgi:hypothetical protein